MKSRLLYIILACCLTSSILRAQQVPEGEITVRDVSLISSPDSLRIHITFDLSDLTIKSNRVIELFPFVQADKETIQLPTVKVMGRRQYISHERNRTPETWGKPLYWVRRINATQQTVDYQAAVASPKSAQGFKLYLDEDLCGCNRTVLASQQRLLAEKKLASEEVAFRLAYRQPQIETHKERKESGSAFINFPQSGTKIVLDFQQNRFELAKIDNMIQKVLSDADVHIDRINIKGYASPEGNYSTNEQLAQQRTAALVEWLVDRHQLPSKLFTVASGAEDWEGLRSFITDSDWDEKSEMLTIINGEGSQDMREQRLRSEFPKAYAYLRTECYPKLRHTDYVIHYSVRAFNVEEAKRIIFEQPQKLSLEEMFRVADSFEIGSDAYNEVFEVAVRMFPSDEVANLNAANTALQRKDIKTAERYLKKAGDCPEATIARGVLAYFKDDIKTAERLFREAADHQNEVAIYNLNQLNRNN